MKEVTFCRLYVLALGSSGIPRFLRLPLHTCCRLLAAVRVGAPGAAEAKGKELFCPSCAALAQTRESGRETWKELH